MLINKSPWIEQLNKNRKRDILCKDITVNIAIAGAGIAGVVTAYYILKNTDKTVAVLDGRGLAYGATGHNAGQVVSYFERPFVSIVEEYGLSKAAEAQRAVDNAWLLLEQIITEAKLTLPFAQFMGFAGLCDRISILNFLEDNFLKQLGGAITEHLFVAKDHVVDIPKKFNGLYTYRTHEEILKLLETGNKKYIAALGSRNGCINSALLCEELVGYMFATYKNRFFLYEHSKVDEIKLHADSVVSLVNYSTVTSDKIILCTNGFTDFTILNFDGKQCNEQFHQQIVGNVGYMAGYLEDARRPATAIRYVGKEESYYYLTRRSFESESYASQSLVCIGGPERALKDEVYHRTTHDHPDNAMDDINNFLQSDFVYAPKKITHEFRWHGLMGYTKNKIRIVGESKVNNRLLYNLGCNGVGILPSIMGGERISQIVKGIKLEGSIFDPN